MPKLPQQEKERDFELADKASLNRGTIDNSKPVIKKYYRKFPVKLVSALTVLVLILVVIYAGVMYLYPILIKKKPETVIANVDKSKQLFNADAIKFSDAGVKEKFMKNLDLASKEPDKEKSFRYLDTNFGYLYEMYSSTHLPEYAVQMEKFKDYMNKNYPSQYQKYLGRYVYVCADEKCWEAHDMGKPAEIVDIRKSLDKIDSMSTGVKGIIVMSIDIGLLSTDKKVQSEAFIGAFNVLSGEYKRSKSSDVKMMYSNLSDYVGKNYPDIKIPDDAKIGN